jgi:hypothetical protein
MSKIRSRIPPDFPREHRLGDALLFRELLGDPGRSTFARYLQLGLIPPPDKKLGTLNRWFETTMAAAVEALPTGRARQLRYGNASGDDRAVAVMAPALVDVEKSKNIITRRADGTTVVVLMPFESELTANERNAIAATRGRVRFFVYGGSDAPAPVGITGPIKLKDFPIETLCWAIGHSTLISAETLEGLTGESMPSDLVPRLLELDAKADNSDHRFAVMFVSEHVFDVDEIVALHRPHAHGQEGPPIVDTAAT